MLRKPLSELTLGAALLLTSGIALAASASANLAVSAAVSQNCTISTSVLAFGAYDPVFANASAALNASGSVTVACTKGATGLSIGMNNGSNFSGTRRTTDGSSNYLSYTLSQPPNNTPSAACTFPGATAWGNTVGTDTLGLTNAPDKNARTYNVCGTIPGGQDSPVGSYSDTVSATINF